MLNSIMLKDILSVSIYDKKVFTSKNKKSTAGDDKLSLSLDIKTVAGDDMWILLENSNNDIDVIVNPQILPTVKWEVDK